MSKEAMKLALEALNVYEHKAEHRRTYEDNYTSEKAITALREALAEQPDVPETNFGNMPAQRKPLTDDDVDVIWAKLQTQPFKTHAEDRMAFARALEAAHGIKE